MKILLVNSTGFNALFLTALMTMRKAGITVRAVLPDRDRTWAGGSRTFDEPVHAHRADQPNMGGELTDVWICDGTPVDCVLAGLTRFRDTDFVMAGPHPYLTPAYHKRWSGLLNAAQEASAHRLPTVAVSTEPRPNWFSDELQQFSKNFGKIFSQVFDLPTRIGITTSGPLNLNMVHEPRNHSPIIRLPLKPNRPSPMMTVSPLATPNDLILIQDRFPDTNSEIEHAHIQGQHSLTLLTGL